MKNHKCNIWELAGYKLHQKPYQKTLVLSQVHKICQSQPCLDVMEQFTINFNLILVQFSIRH